MRGDTEGTVIILVLLVTHALDLVLVLGLQELSEIVSGFGADIILHRDELDGLDRSCISLEFD